MTDIAKAAAALAEAAGNDDFGDNPEVRTTYAKTTEGGVKGTLIPSAEPVMRGGGSHGFSVNDKVPVIRDPGTPMETVYIPGEDDTKAEPEQAQEEVPAPKPAKVAQAVPEPALASNEEQPKAPTKRLVVDLPGMGTLDTYYHAIFREGIQLVLVWDTRYTGQRYTPSEGMAMMVKVGKEAEALRVTVPGIGFTHGNNEYTILLIDEGVPNGHGEDGGTGDWTNALQ